MTSTDQFLIQKLIEAVQRQEAVLRQHEEALQQVAAILNLHGLIPRKMGPLDSVPQAQPPAAQAAVAPSANGSGRQSAPPDNEEAALQINRAAVAAGPLPIGIQIVPGRDGEDGTEHPDQVDYGTTEAIRQAMQQQAREELLRQQKLEAAKSKARSAQYALPPGAQPG